MRARRRTQRSVAFEAVLLAAALIVAGILIRQLLSLILAVMITLIVAIPLDACASWLNRRFRVPRALGVLAGLLAGFAALAAVLAIVIPAFASEAQRFADSLPGIVDSLRASIRDATGAQPGDVADAAQRFVQRYLDHPARLIDPLTTLGASLAGIAAGFVIVLMTAYYVAVRPQPLVRGVLRLLPPERREGGLAFMREVRSAWIGWLRGVTLDMLVAGVTVYVALKLVGVDFAIVFAVLTAALVVVPYFGGIVAGIPPVLFALTVSPGKAALVLLAYIVAQQIEGNVILPLIMSRTVKLHPAVVAVGVLIVGTLLGFLGLFIAVPILSLATIAVRRLWVEPMEERSRERVRADSTVVVDGPLARRIAR